MPHLRWRPLQLPPRRAYLRRRPKVAKGTRENRDDPSVAGTRPPARPDSLRRIQTRLHQNRRWSNRCRRRPHKPHRTSRSLRIRTHPVRCPNLGRPFFCLARRRAETRTIPRWPPGNRRTCEPKTKDAGQKLIVCRLQPHRLFVTWKANARPASVAMSSRDAIQRYPRD